jgi:hypothetical protein
VSAGAAGRDYTEYFYRSGRAFVGGSSQRSAMTRVVAGDTIMLKRGLSEFSAAEKTAIRSLDPQNVCRSL